MGGVLGPTAAQMAGTTAKNKSLLGDITGLIGTTLTGGNNILKGIDNATLLALLGLGAYGNYEIGSKAGQVADLGINLANKYANLTPAQINAQIQALGQSPEQLAAQLKAYGLQPAEITAALQSYGLQPQQIAATLKSYGLTPDQISATMQQYGQTPQGIQANLQNYGVNPAQLRAETAEYNLDPANVGKQIQRLQTPIDQNLINNTMEQVQAQLASRGLSVSPSVAYTMALTALAPYEQQNQQLASQEFYQGAGLVGQEAQNAAALSGSELSSAQQQLFNQRQTGEELAFQEPLTAEQLGYNQQLTAEQNAFNQYLQNRGLATSTFFNAEQLPLEALNAIHLPNPANLSGITEALGANLTPNYPGATGSPGAPGAPGAPGVPGVPSVPGVPGAPEPVPPVLNPPIGAPPISTPGPYPSDGTPLPTGTGATTILDDSGNPIAGGSAAVGGVGDPNLPSYGSDIPTSVPGVDLPGIGGVVPGGVVPGLGVGGGAIAGLGGLEGLPGFGAGSAELGATGTLAGITDFGTGAGVAATGDTALDGIATEAAGQVGASAGATGSLLSAIAPIVGAGAAFFGPIAALVATGIIPIGPNPGNVPEAKTEQQFEVAADNILSAVKGGYVPASSAVAALSQLDYTAQQQVTAAGKAAAGGNVSSGGGTNVSKQIESIISAIKALPPVTQKAGGASLPKGETSGFVQPGTAGWYPGSIAGGTQLGDTLIQSMLNDPTKYGTFPATSPDYITKGMSTTSGPGLAAAIRSTGATPNPQGGRAAAPTPAQAQNARIAQAVMAKVPPAQRVAVLRAVAANKGNWAAVAKQLGIPI